MLAHFEVVSPAIPSLFSCDEANSANQAIDQCHTSHSRLFPPSASPHVDSIGEDDYRIHSHSTCSTTERKGRNALHPIELSEHSLPIMDHPITYLIDLQTVNEVTAESMDLLRSPDSHLLPSFLSFPLPSPTSIDGCRMNRAGLSNTIPHSPPREDPI